MIPALTIVTSLIDLFLLALLMLMVLSKWLTPKFPDALPRYVNRPPRRLFDKSICYGDTR